MTVVPSLDIVLDARAELGESPVWDHRTQQLHWVDILRGDVHTYDPRTAEDRIQSLPRSVGAVALYQPGSLVLAADDGFRLLDLTTGASHVIRPVEDDRPDTRMNDGKVDAAGRFWAGTMSRTGAPPAAGTLYRLDPDRTVRVMLRHVSVSNGLGWSPDGRYLYHIDSPTRTVKRYRAHDDGTLSDPSVLVDTAAYPGTPDGMSVDAEGCLWICFWQGHSVRRFHPDGPQLHEIPLPVTQPTSCTFGGADLTDLYLTTARHGLTPTQLADQPHAGALLVLHTPTPGLPAHPWRG